MTTALVTGGAGFLGSHVAAELLAAGCAVVCLDDLSGGYAQNVPNGALLVEGSVTDGALVSALFESHAFDYVFHLAAYAAEGLSHFIRHFNYSNNVIGSINVINACIRRPVKRIVYTSSIAVYGAGSATHRFAESDMPRPADPYGIAKLAMEYDLQAAHAVFDLPYTVFRPHNVFGERQNIGDRYRNVVGIFMRQLLQGEPMTIFGDGEQTRAFTYVGDVAGCIARCIEMPHTACRVYNVGADLALSVNALAAAVAEALGKDCRVCHLPARHEAAHAAADHALFRKDFGERSATPLREGLERMVSWVLENGIRESRSFDNIEVRRNLPRAWQGRDG